MTVFAHRKAPLAYGFRLCTAAMRCLVILVLVAAAPAALHAEEKGWYAGAGAAYTDYRGPDVIRDLSGHGLSGTTRLDTQAFPWELFVGYRAANDLGVEAEYLHLKKLEGKLDLTAPVVNSVDGMQETDGFSVSGYRTLPLTRLFSLTVSGGLYVWHIHSAASSLASATAVAAVEDHRGVAPRGGMTLEGQVSARSSLRLRWTLMELDGISTNIYSLDFVHYFGKAP